jgi:hypothetical protein
VIRTTVRAAIAMRARMSTSFTNRAKARVGSAKPPATGKPNMTATAPVTPQRASLELVALPSVSQGPAAPSRRLFDPAALGSDSPVTPDVAARYAQAFRNPAALKLLERQLQALRAVVEARGTGGMLSRAFDAADSAARDWLDVLAEQTAATEGERELTRQEAKRGKARSDMLASRREPLRTAARRLRNATDAQLVKDASRLSEPIVVVGDERQRLLGLGLTAAQLDKIKIRDPIAEARAQRVKLKARAPAMRAQVEKLDRFLEDGELHHIEDIDSLASFIAAQRAAEGQPL